MANLQHRQPEYAQDGQDGMVRRWDRETNSFGRGGSDASGFRTQVEQVLDLLIRRKWLIVGTCLLVLAGATWHTYTQVPLYRASSLVLIERESKGASQMGFMSPSSSSEFLASGKGSIRNELVVLRNSRSLRQRVAERLVERGLAGRFLGSSTQSKIGRLVERAWTRVRRAFGGKDGSEKNEPSPQEGTQPDAAAAKIAARLEGQIQFSPSEQTSDAIRVTAFDDDSELVADLVNLYVEEYVALTRESSRAQVTASRTFLQEQAEKRKKELRAIEQQIQTYKRNEGAIALSQRGGDLVDEISNLEVELEKARLELQMERKSLTSLQKQLDSIRPEELSRRVESSSKEEIEALRSRIAQLKMAKQDVRLRSGAPTSADSAQVAQIDSRIRELQSRLSSLSDEYVNEIMSGGVTAEASAERIKDLTLRIADKRVRISGLETRIDILSDRLEETEQELRSVPEKSMQLAQLERRKSYVEQMYQYVMKQVQNARVREESELGYANIVSEATAPGQLVRPRPGRNLSLGLIIGLLGGLGLALVRDVLDNRVYKPDRLGELGYREIGTIPDLAPIIDDHLEGKMTVEQNGRKLQTSLICAVDPISAAAEAYRQLGTRIELGGADEKVSTLVVTSPGAGDGKSVTAANLAIAMAQAGHDTLLVDTDLHRPRLHKLFERTQSPGLSEALEDGMENQIRSSDIDNLSILPAGESVKSPSEIIGSSRFRQFLDGAKEHFDVIILDAPPVLATADAALLSSRVDSTLCVVRAGRTTESELDRAMNALSEVGARVTGVVFNGFDVSMAYGYRYRYRHYDEYGHYNHYSALTGPSD